MLLPGMTHATDCADAPVSRSLLQYGDVIFTGAVKEHVNSFARFHVMEALKGVRADGYIDVLGLESHFAEGGQYLVFARRLRNIIPAPQRPDATRGCLVSEGCASSYSLPYAQAVLNNFALRRGVIGWPPFMEWYGGELSFPKTITRSRSPT